MSENLDAVSSEYRPNGATAIENDLILHWYPKQIVKRMGHVNRLLELGIGHGYTAKLFNTACNEHVIIDGAPSVITQFQSRHPDFKGRVIEGYFEEFESDANFDAIIMGFVLEHVDDPELILNRYRRFLSPGGKMYVAVPNAKSLNRRLGLELGMIDDIYSLNANDLALGHQRQYCRTTLRATLENTGYKVTHEEGIYLKPLPLPVLMTLPDWQANLQAMLRVGVDFPDLCVGLLMETEAT